MTEPKLHPTTFDSLETGLTDTLQEIKIRLLEQLADAIIKHLASHGFSLSDLLYAFANVAHQRKMAETEKLLEQASQAAQEER